MRKFFLSLFKLIAGAIVLALVVGIVGAVIGELFIEYAKEKGAYDNPSQKVDSMTNSVLESIASFVDFINSGVFRICVGILIAFGLGLGLCLFAIRYDDKKKTRAEEKKFEDEGYIPLPEKPSEIRIFANILNRRDDFTLREAALLFVDRKLTGELSTTANAQLQELRRMMRDGKLKRAGGLTIHEAINESKAVSVLYMVQNNELPMPPATARISRETLYNLSVELSLPIAGLKP